MDVGARAEVDAPANHHDVSRHLAVHGGGPANHDDVAVDDLVVVDRNRSAKPHAITTAAIAAGR